jgi:hypothetical protein
MLIFLSDRQTPSGWIGSQNGLDVPATTRRADRGLLVLGGIYAVYAWYRGRTTGLTAGLDADVGYALARLVDVAGVQLGLHYDVDEAVYICPRAPRAREGCWRSHIGRQALASRVAAGSFLRMTRCFTASLFRSPGRPCSS